MPLGFHLVNVSQSLISSRQIRFPLPPKDLLSIHSILSAELNCANFTLNVTRDALQDLLSDSAICFAAYECCLLMSLNLSQSHHSMSLLLICRRVGRVFIEQEEKLLLMMTTT